ncbi:hypothetical protein BURK_008536 [Burkholderia sp. SJ98]|nr:hypothetical protein BURK_008536 [Burkholderia sp. SJ98]
MGDAVMVAPEHALLQRSRFATLCHPVPVQFPTACRIAPGIGLSGVEHADLAGAQGQDKLHKQCNPSDGAPHLQHLTTAVVAAQFAYAPDAIRIITINLVFGHLKPVRRARTHMTDLAAQRTLSPLPVTKMVSSCQHLPKLIDVAIRKR